MSPKNPKRLYNSIMHIFTTSMASFDLILPHSKLSTTSMASFDLSPTTLSIPFQNMT